MKYAEVKHAEGSIVCPICGDVLHHREMIAGTVWIDGKPRSSRESVAIHLRRQLEGHLRARCELSWRQREDEFAAAGEAAAAAR